MRISLGGPGARQSLRPQLTTVNHTYIHLHSLYVNIMKVDTCSRCKFNIHLGNISFKQTVSEIIVLKQVFDSQMLFKLSRMHSYCQTHIH